MNCFCSTFVCVVLTPSPSVCQRLCAYACLTLYSICVNMFLLLVVYHHLQYVLACACVCACVRCLTL